MRHRFLRRSLSFSCLRRTKPRRCTLNATIDSATIRANPSAPSARTRSRPRCSRLLIADSIAGCWRRALRKVSGRLALTIGLRPTALAWQYVVIQQGIQSYPVLRTVKAAVKAAQAQVWILLLRPLDDRHCNIPSAAFPHDLVMQNETVIVHHHAHRYTQLHRTTRLTLRYPARVRLEYRKYLLCVGHHLALDQSPLHLIQLTTRMLDVVLYTRATSHQFWTLLARQLPQRLLGPPQQLLAKTPIIFLTGWLRIRLTLPAYPVEGVFYTSRQMLPLTPAAHIVLLRCTGPVSRIRQRIESHSRLVSVGWCTSVSTTKESHRPHNRSPNFFFDTS